MNWLSFLAIFAAILFVWCAVPSLAVLMLPGMLIRHRRAAARHFVALDQVGSNTSEGVMRCSTAISVPTAFSLPSPPI